MELGQKIVVRLKELGLTQTELAHRLGLTSAAISKYVQGKAKPSYENILILSKMLKVHPGFFFPDEPSKSSQDGRKSQSTIPNPNPTVADTIPLPTKGKFARGGTFVIGHYLPMQQFVSPILAVTHGIITNFYSLIFNSLAQWVPSGRWRSGRFRGVLAIDWKPVDNSWMFQLREGVRFHDGKRLVMEDVLWSYEQYLRQNPNDRRMAGIRVLDRQFIQILLKSPCRLEELQMPFIVPFGAKDDLAQWVGTGPFEPIELKPGFWRLRKNPHYFFAQPFFDEIHIREYKDRQTLEQALVDGEVHFAIGVNYPGRDFIVKPEASVMRYHLHFVLKENVVQNPFLRKAISLALDRQVLAKAAGLKEPQYSAGPFDYFLGDYASRPELPDRTMAKHLLKQVPELQNSVFRVQFYPSVPQSGPLAEAIVAQLNRIGILAEIGEPPHAIVVIRLADSIYSEYEMYRTSTPQNLCGYSNSEVDKRIEVYKNTSTTDAQLLELRGLIQLDTPDIPLFYYEDSLTYIKKLRALEGRVVLLTGLNDIHNWYIEVVQAEAVRRAASA